MLFGPNSLVMEQEAKEKGKKKHRLWSGPHPNAVLWGLNKVTPGVIALSAVIVSLVVCHASSLIDDFFTGDFPPLRRLELRARGRDHQPRLHGSVSAVRGDFCHDCDKPANTSDDSILAAPPLPGCRIGGEATATRPA